MNSAQIDKKGKKKNHRGPSSASAHKAHSSRSNLIGDLLYMYGFWVEYIFVCAYRKAHAVVKGIANTPACKMCNDRAVKYQLIQHRLLEPAGSDPDFTRGTLEGDIAPSDITFYRLQCDSEGNLRSYIAEGEILPVATRSFGGIAVFGIHEMGRFYRHVLVQKRYPHHGAVAFGHYGKILFEVLKFLGIQDIAYNQPKSLPYPTENPFA